MSVLCFLSSVFCLEARAETLNDPTQPPAGWAAPQKEETREGDGALVLQSVLISPTRRAAVISGRTVTMGAKVGEARVVRIDETQVVLKTGAGTQVLKLFPGVDWHPVKADGPGGRKKR